MIASSGPLISRRSECGTLNGLIQSFLKGAKSGACGAPDPTLSLDRGNDLIRNIDQPEGGVPFQNEDIQLSKLASGPLSSWSMAGFVEQ